MKTSITIFATTAMALALAACDAPERDPRLQMDEEAVDEGPTGPMLADVFAERDDLSTLADLIEQTGMGPSLEGASDFTLLAPTDEAWEAMDETAREFLLDEANASSLRAALGYHMLRSSTTAEEIGANAEGGTDGQADFQTSNNYPLAARITEEGEVEFFNNRSSGKVVAADIQVANGTVHVIDGVLIVPESRAGTIGEDEGE